MMVQPPIQGQEENTENPIKIINPTAIPNKVFVLTATDQEILDNLKKLPQENIQGHLTEADTKRRLKIYRKRNEPNTGVETLQDFFEENHIDVHHLHLGPQLLPTLQSEVKPIEPKEEEETNKINSMLQKNQSDEGKKREREDKKEKIKRDIQLQDYKIKKQNEQNEQKQILEKKSLALRKYLDSNVVPFLVQGIKKILKDLPANPVDHLAQHLFKVSLNVPNPDPSTFDQ